MLKCINNIYININKNLPSVFVIPYNLYDNANHLSACI